MTDEEKEAIKTLEHWKDYNKKYKSMLLNADEIIEVQEIILNLIDKMQKENELLKTTNAALERNIANIKELNQVIPKSQIEDKIKELEKEIEEKRENGVDFTLIFEHEVDTNGIIQVLKELIESEGKINDR